MIRCVKLSSSLFISASILLLDTKAISIPEKKAENSIAMSIDVISKLVF